jgi:hypothetical protein
MTCCCRGRPAIREDSHKRRRPGWHLAGSDSILSPRSHHVRRQQLRHPPRHRGRRRGPCHLAALDSTTPLEGSILIGELHGEAVAALSLDDDRALADPFRPTAHLLATMRVRARGLKAVDHMPSLRERLLAGLPTSYRARLAGRRA